MNNLARILSLGAALGLTAALSAQTGDTGGPRGPGGGGPGRGPGGPGRGPGGPGRGGHPIVRVLDADKDGTISAAEIANAAKAILTLDSNGDGKISKDDAPVPPADSPQRPADAPTPPDGERPHPNDPIMLALDANTDGELSAAEIANAPTSLKALDLNKDGVLTPDEYRPLPPEGADHPPRG
jgi:hypothetical protein